MKPKKKGKNISDGSTCGKCGPVKYIFTKRRFTFPARWSDQSRSASAAIPAWIAMIAGRTLSLRDGNQESWFNLTGTVCLPYRSKIRRI